ncbi:General transcription factor IIH subunit 3 [Lignoscripta atroalba]|nr:General transcription factor IIH subunit 3 [Lignoscripta atroalba]
MNAVDGSEHYEKTSNETPPSLLTIILDTNPHAWALLSGTLPLSKAIANLLVFINAHLAFNYANKVAIIASHTQRAEFLYPTPSGTSSTTSNGDAPQQDAANGSDTEMANNDEDDPTAPKPKLTLNGPKPHPQNGTHPSLTRSNTTHITDDANKYRPFRLVEEALFSAISTLLSSTVPDSLINNPTTSIAGALTLALTYTNKQTLLLSTSASSSTGPSSTAGPINPNGNDGLDPSRHLALQSRILILSVSGDLAHQYIPIMNCIFAAQRLSIPIDICKIAGDTVFLQQASDATRGTYIKLEHPQGLLQYLMMGFLPDQSSRRNLISPTQVGVDFRAACFCHRKVVDIGFVCSICLSIFCSPPEGATCLTCGTHLRLGDYGGKPAVVPRKRKKRKNRLDGEGRASMPGGTPGPS